MDPESGRLLRCEKHSLQTFTGICPSCLAERLSSVDPDKRNPASYCGDVSSLDGVSPSAKVSQPEDVDVTEVEKVEHCSCVLPVPEKQLSNLRVRQTLWSLFYLNNDDDGNERHLARSKTESESLFGRMGSSLFEIGLNCEANFGYGKISNGCKKRLCKSSVSVMKAKNFSNEDWNTTIFNDWGFNSGAASSSVDNTSTDTQSCRSGNTREGVYYVAECRAPRSVANKYTQVESSVDDEEGNIPSTAHDGDRFNDSVEGHVLQRSSSVRMGFGLVKRLVGWRMKFTQKNSKTTDEGLGGGIHSLPSASVVGQSHHPSKKEFSDSISGSSWDVALMVGKTLTRSLSVGEDRNESSSKDVEVGEMPNPPRAENRDSFSDSLPHVRRTTKRVGSVDFDWTTETKDTNKIISVSMDEDKSACSVGFNGESRQERLSGSLMNQWSCGKKFHGCSKVWDRMCANPFWGFVQKSENVLDRSLSECWHESRKEKNREAAVESYNKEGRFHRNSSVSVRSLDKSQDLVDTSSTIDSNLYGFHSIWKRKKNLRALAPSRSIQYSSPNNLDNGLLRFYLTPIRYNRRCSSRNTRRNPHYFL